MAALAIVEAIEGTSGSLLIVSRRLIGGKHTHSNDVTEDVVAEG